MDPEHLRDIFADFGPVTIKKMFSGHGISVDGVNFAMSLKSGMIFRVDDLTVHRYEAEGAKPFSYSTSKKTVVVQSYRHLPERLYDDTEELAVWAREALEAARRAKLKTSRRKPATKRAAAPSKSAKAAETKSAKNLSTKKNPSTKKAASKRGRSIAKSNRKAG